MICSNFMGGTVDVDQSRSAPYRQLAKINWNLMLVSFIKEKYPRKTRQLLGCKLLMKPNKIGDKKVEFS